ncbi:MAG: hypothetical protein IPH07_18405 [Deltaproteobacteria bacterium]|nr:hypothetical protein [Deltaproteobacteria bacterium]MBK8715674.1 hypothetical protein [Deltaproteobacteria bacterium]
MAVWVVVAALTGCGAAVDVPVCTDPPQLELTHPDGLEDDLVDAAVKHAQERLDEFMSPLHGYAFQGRFQSTSGDENVSVTDARALLLIEGDWVRLHLSDVAEPEALVLDYHPPWVSDRITANSQHVVCPAELPVPEPAEPFLLPATLCEGTNNRDDTELSIDIVPVAADDIDWNDLLFLNDLRTGGTPYSSEFESSGRAHTVLDQASYRSGAGDIRVYVDYEARWEIDRDCLASHAIVTIDILHAERCDISGHTHGRYDSYCVTIATIDGRPQWASGF